MSYGSSYMLRSLKLNFIVELRPTIFTVAFTHIASFLVLSALSYDKYRTTDHYSLQHSGLAKKCGLKVPKFCRLCCFPCVFYICSLWMSPSFAHRRIQILKFLFL